MTPNHSDSQLVRDYAAEGSESAFRALVARHVNLVYATALRQIGDAGAAEEITQNVFVTLARKAPRLAGVATLAGWLHRATILEAKARVRLELRRERREQTAALLESVQREGASPLETLVPLLDEALLGLRDGDRLALLLRFFEDRSLRDVGVTLGVDEDAARKRVSRALERVTEFFRKRGFAIPAGTGAAALLASSAQAAPSTLADSVVGAGLTAGGTTTGLNLLLLHTMALTKTQSALLCAAMVALPMTLQWRAEGRNQRALDEVQTRLASIREELTGRKVEIQRSQAALAAMRTEHIQADGQQASVDRERAAVPAAAVYAWDDASTLARVPKEMLQRIRLQALSSMDGKLSGQIVETLQMSEGEAIQVETIVRQFIADFQAVEAANLKPVAPRPADLDRRAPEEVRVFELPDLSEEMQQLRAPALASLREVLGDQRFKLFEKALGDRLPLNDTHDGVHSQQVLFPTAKRLVFYRPEKEAETFLWNIAITHTSGGGSGMGLDYDPPEPYRRHLADWLEQLQLSRAERALRGAAVGKGPLP